MPLERERLLELALQRLRADKERLDSEIQQIESELRRGSRAGTAPAARRTERMQGRQRKPGRRLTPEQRQLISDRMRQVWAERRRKRK